MKSSKDHQAVQQLGLGEISQSKLKLRNTGVHYYSMGKSDVVHKIAAAVF